MFLENINTPADVKKLNNKELCILCDEIRAFLIENVSKTGGHLSSNLGTIELTVALHSIFDTPLDKIVWDVGHQCYTHKILTKRKDKFDKLRMLNGLSGFPMPKESEHDAFISGHGNTAISAAIGMAQAKKIANDNKKVIAVVGDGAFTGGMIYEGMNNVRALSNLIVILNDNKMSISKNVGSVSQYLTHLRTSPNYFKFKRFTQSFLDKIPVVGEPVRKWLQKIKMNFRRRLYQSTMFEDMGFHYVGTIDGHNLGELRTILSAYKGDQSAPLFIHIVTKKGKGFAPAEENPGEFHGVSAFDINSLSDPDITEDNSFSTIFGKELAQLANENEKICAITAAMKYGTGLQYFYRSHKERFFDVGMAEQHAVTFAAGLASCNMKPVVCIYSTFLQRAYDQIIHDVNLQNLDVLFAIDRAGLVPGDGETHQGVYDCAFLSQLPNMKVLAVCNYDELCHWMKKLLNEQGPRAIRYPRGSENESLSLLGCTGKEYDVYRFENAPLEDNKKEITSDLHENSTSKTDKEIKKCTAIITYGALAAEAIKAAEKNKNAHVFKLLQVHPLPIGFIDEISAYNNILFAEEGVQSGGIGEHVSSALQHAGYRGTFKHVAADVQNLTHASVEELKTLFGLDADSLSKLL